MTRLRPWFGLLAVLCACEPLEIPIGFTIDLPPDSDDLERADNATVRLSPGDDLTTFAVDGLNFSLQLELAPDDEPRRVALFLAEGDTLLAWGETPAFPLSSAAAVRLYIGRPGTWSGFGEPIEAPDPDVLVTPLRSSTQTIGFLGLETDGATFLFDGYGLSTTPGARLTVDEDDPLGPLLATDGALVTDGAVPVRLAWTAGIRGWAYDFGGDQWVAIAFEGAVEPRPGAAWVTLDNGSELVLLGGPDPGVLRVTARDGTVTRDDLALDVARSGAAAVTLADDADAAEPWLAVVGGVADEPLVWARDGTGAVTLAGPRGPAWTGATCIDLGPDAAARARGLCGGGTRAAAVTPDAVELVVPRDTDGLLVIEHPGLLLAPMAQPLWFADASALYAQGAGQMARIARADLSASPVPGSFPRDAGGSSATLGAASTFVLGGRTPDGTAVDRWHVFVPVPGEG